MRLLFVIAFSTVVWLAAFMSVQAAIIKPMPPVVVLIVCKADITKSEDSNDEWTHHEEISWVIEDGKMACRRIEVSLYNPGNPAADFTPAACQRAGPMVSIKWDEQHKSGMWRTWRTACPTPIMRKNPDNTEDIIDWLLPDCGHRDIVKCDVDTEI